VSHTQVEIDELLCQTAVRRAREAGVGHLVEVRAGDVAEACFSDASLVVVFLVPSCLAALSPLLKEQCAPGTRIVAYKFPLPHAEGWSPLATSITDDVVKKGAETDLYLYNV
jgi:hypothetical protein